LFWLRAADFGPGFAPKNPKLDHRQVNVVCKEQFELGVIRLSLEYGAMECRAFASIGWLFVCVLVGGQAVAQTAGTGPVGKPIQLLQLMHPGNSAAKSHERSAAEHRSKSHPAAKKPASTKLASKESTSNGAPHVAAVVAAAAAPQVPPAPTSETAWSAVKAIRPDIRDHLVGAAVQAIRVDIRDHLVGAVQAIVAQNAAWAHSAAGLGDRTAEQTGDR
jgi:hypothetical protein